MSTLAYLADGDLAAGVELTATVALEVFWSNPEAVLDLVYGPTRRITGAAPPHDHDEDGGEPHALPILQRSFGRYQQNLSGRGIPLGPPASGTFAATEDNGETSYSNAKRLDCVMVVIPGGVSSVKVSLSEYHETTGKPVILYVALRSLSSVNFKLGVAPEEVRGTISYTTSGTPGTSNQTVTLDELGSLGDPTLDREIEASLWLGSDLDSTTEHRIYDWEIVAVGYTEEPREASLLDLAYPALAVREFKAGLGQISPLLIGKSTESYNALNRALWGSTPGLLPDLKPDLRRSYQETINGVHQHQGSWCPQADLSIVGDGAVLRDTQSFGFLTYLGETLPLVAATPPTMDHRPSQGQFLHLTDDLSVGWYIYRFRRSIPAGCGELRLRIAATASVYDTSQKLLVEAFVQSVAADSPALLRLFCGPNASPLSDTEADYGSVEIEPEDDVAYLPGFDVANQNKKGWNRGVEIEASQASALQLLSTTYRISREIRMVLTYPPVRPDDPYRATEDYEIQLRFQMRNADGACDIGAGLLWLCCWSAPGY